MFKVTGVADAMGVERCGQPACQSGDEERVGVGKVLEGVIAEFAGVELEAAALLAISRSKVYELMRSGRLGTVKIDGSRRVPVDAVDDFIAAARTDAA